MSDRVMVSTGTGAAVMGTMVEVNESQGNNQSRLVHHQPTEKQQVQFGQPTSALKGRQDCEHNMTRQKILSHHFQMLKDLNNCKSRSSAKRRIAL